MTLSQIPSLNAFLNFCSLLCLLGGFWAIKKGQESLHKKLMLSAFGFSSLFLTGYLIYHYHHPTTRFPELGMIKTLYLLILFTHIVFAIVIVPLILTTLYKAWKKDWKTHKKLAKITFPMWTYVSFTGIIIYLMLYHLFAA